MDIEKFLTLYETATNSHDFSRVQPLIDPRAIYYFSDGTFVGIEAIQEAFENTWNKVKNEVYSIDDVQWLIKNREVGVCIYKFNWRGMVNNEKKEGSGRGTNVIINTSLGWKIVHEHLSRG